MFAAGPVGEPAELVINMTSPQPMAMVSVILSYSPQQLQMTSFSAVEGSALSNVELVGTVDEEERMVLTLTASGGEALTSGGVARLLFLTLSSGSLTLESLVTGLGVTCIGCQW